MELSNSRIIKNTFIIFIFFFSIFIANSTENSSNLDLEYNCDTFSNLELDILTLQNLIKEYKGNLAESRISQYKLNLENLENEYNILLKSCSNSNTKISPQKQTSSEKNSFENINQKNNELKNMVLSYHSSQNQDSQMSILKNILSTNIDKMELYLNYKKELLSKSNTSTNKYQNNFQTSLNQLKDEIANAQSIQKLDSQKDTLNNITNQYKKYLLHNNQLNNLNKYDNIFEQLDIIITDLNNKNSINISTLEQFNLLKKDYTKYKNTLLNTNIDELTQAESTNIILQKNNIKNTLKQLTNTIRNSIK